MLKFLEIMEEKDQAILTIVKGISIMIQLRKQFNKPFCQITKDDMKLLFKWMDNKGYRVETHEKFRAVLKKFFKMVYGNNESYPESVKWFTVKVGKVNQYFKDRIESFDDYYPYMQKDECNLLHAYNWIQFFVSMYNDTTSNKNDFIIQLQEEVENLS